MKNLIHIRSGLAVAVIVGLTGLLAIEARGQSTAAVPAGTNNAPAMQNAQTAVRLLALQSPNPFVRETVYAERDKDWTIDLAKLTFSVKIRGPEAKTATGKLVMAGDGQATAAFDDEAALSRGWVVPTETKLTAEEAVRCLVEMSDDMPEDTMLKRICDAMKAAKPEADPSTGEVKGRGNGATASEYWQISLQERTFWILMSHVEDNQGYSGSFGWNKDKKWTAWPILFTTAVIGRGMSEHVLIPK